MKKAEAIKLLGVSGKFDTQEIETAFKAQARDKHPDSGGSHQEMADLNEARAVLLRGIARSKELITVEDATGLLDQAYEEWQSGLEKDRLKERNLSDRLDDHFAKIDRKRNLAASLALISFGLFFAHKEIPYDLLFETNEETQSITDRLRLLTFLAGSACGLTAFWIDRRKDVFANQKDKASVILDSRIRVRHILKTYTAEVDGKIWTKKQLTAEFLKRGEAHHDADVRSLLSMVNESDLPEILIARGKRFGVLHESDAHDETGTLIAKYRVK